MALVLEKNIRQKRNLCESSEVTQNLACETGALLLAAGETFLTLDVWRN